MRESDTLIKNRLRELAEKSYRQGIYCFTDFLGLSELAVFAELSAELSGIPYTAFGGADGAERVMIRFGSEELSGYTEDFPILCLKIEPKMRKYSDELTHRDFLGALMTLGIERKMLGDIIIHENSGYVFVKDTVANFVIEELGRVKHTDVCVSVDTLPPISELYRTKELRLPSESERLDGVIAKLFSISRESAQALFGRGLVFVGGRVCSSCSYVPRESEVISVRGYGRFIYRGYVSTTKKGKLNVTVELYV